MKPIFALTFFLFLSITTFAQDKFKVCNPEKVYAIGNKLLTKHVNGEINEPKVWPKWPKGLDSLQQFFDKKLLYKVDKSEPIQRIILMLTVDCNGNSGDFKIISKDELPIEPEILKVCRNHMEKWIPAKHKKQNVDSHQLIIFSIANSKVKVRYKEGDK